MKLQRAYVVRRTLDGIVQVGQPQAPQGTTTFDLPVVATTMMNVATDSFAAVGLGYGTTDFPSTVTLAAPKGGGLGLPLPTSYARASTALDLPYDYLIGAKFHVLISLKGSLMEWDLDLASIAELRPDPTSAQGLTASLLTLDRPSTRDTKCFESRQVQWSPSLLPQAYGIAVERPGANPVFLNTPRLGGKGYQPYIPVRPRPVDGEMAFEARSTFVDRYGQQPFTGSDTTRYSVVSTDVFGRWTSWSQASFVSTAAPVLKPGLDKVAFEPLVGAAGATIAGSFVVDFSWDWADRSPDVIELTGKYFAGEGNVPPGAVPPAGFEVTPGTPGSPVLIKFDVTGKPFIASAVHMSVGDVQQVDVLQDSSTEVRKYRLVLKGSAKFSASVKKVGFAVYARGSESKRPAGTFSLPVGPRTTYVFDPTAPVVSFPTPQVTWASLPDVTGHSRARLSWPAAPGAQGYFVWMATETALATKAGLDLPQGDIEARAKALKDFVTNAVATQNEDAIRVFTRLNDSFFTGTSYEVEVPGASQRLFFFRVSAISKSAVEGPRSSSVFAVGVPQRIQPGPPKLVLRSLPDAQPPAIKVIVLPGQGPKEDGFHVLRVRREVQARDAGVMGPARYEHTSPLWQTEQVEAVRGSPLVAARTLLDPRPPGWFPYYYRVRAVGGMKVDDRDYGRYPGESEASAAQELYHTPSGPPSFVPVTDPYVDSGDTVNVISFQSDLPTRLSPLGVARIELVENQYQPDGTMKRKTVLAFNTQDIPVDTVLPANLDSMVPLIKLGAPFLSFYKSPTNAFTPRFMLYLKLLGKTETVVDPKTQTSYQRPIVGTPRVLRLIDPLGRVTEKPMEQWFYGTF
jgi:hypothetical protein